MSRAYKVNTTIANMGISAVMPLFSVGGSGGLSPGFAGMTATNSTGAPYYVKFYWTGQQNISYSQLSAVMTNAACTVIPSMTVEVPTVGVNLALTWPIINAGQLYLWAVSTAADATNTSLSAGGDAITVFID